MRAGCAILVLSMALAPVTRAPAQAPAAPGVAHGAAASGPAPTTFVVTFKIKPGRNADFVAIMAKVQAALPNSEPGNLYYDLYQADPGSQTYILIEHYKDAAAVQAHGRDPAARAMLKALGDVLDGPLSTAISAERLVLVSSKP